MAVIEKNNISINIKTNMNYLILNFPTFMFERFYCNCLKIIKNFHGQIKWREKRVMFFSFNKPFFSPQVTGADRIPLFTKV